MALQGTLDTFALPDVLHLLAATKKTGCLRLTGSRGTGTVAVRDGGVVDVRADHAPRSVDPEPALFELLRFEDGSFLFDADAEVASGAPREVDELLAAADALLAEWREIESVVPSLRAWVRLRTALDADAVTLSQAVWPTLVAVGEGTTVGGLGDRLELAELPVSRAVRDLVELGVVEVEDRPEEAPEPEVVSDEAPVEAPVEVEPVSAPIQEPTAPTEPIALDVEPPVVASEPPAPEPLAPEPDVVDGGHAVDAALVAPERPALLDAPDEPLGRTEAEHWAEFWGEDAARDADGPGVAADAIGDELPEALPTARPIKARRPRPRTYEAPTEDEQRFVPLELPGHMASPAVEATEDGVEHEDLDELADDDLANAFPGLSGRASAAPVGLVSDTDDPSEPDHEEDGREEAPISRGLLLKFLGSKS